VKHCVICDLGLPLLWMTNSSIMKYNQLHRLQIPSLSL